MANLAKWICVWLGFLETREGARSLVGSCWGENTAKVVNLGLVFPADIKVSPEPLFIFLVLSEAQKQTQKQNPKKTKTNCLFLEDLSLEGKQDLLFPLLECVCFQRLVSLSCALPLFFYHNAPRLSSCSNLQDSFFPWIMSSFLKPSRWRGKHHKLAKQNISLVGLLRCQKSHYCSTWKIRLQLPVAALKFEKQWVHLPVNTYQAFTLYPPVRGMEEQSFSSRNVRITKSRGVWTPGRAWCRHGGRVSVEPEKPWANIRFNRIQFYLRK